MTVGSPEPGVLLVDKPSGPTSRDVVNQVMRALRIRRVGHAGTLDPFAEGLLLIAWGSATGLIPYLQQYPKTYEVEAEFGRVTDTQDRTGATLAEASAENLREDTIRVALAGFRGRISQVPPMYSAVKHEGRRMYELARAGLEVPRAPRERTVFSFELTGFDSPRATFRVACEGGTYVRTLIHDLGAELGPGGCVVRLVRTAIGPHSREGAVNADLLPGPDRAALLARALSPAAALPDWPEIRIGEEREEREVLCGSWRDTPGRAVEGREYRITGRDGRLLALARGGRPVRLLRVMSGPQVS